MGIELLDIDFNAHNRENREVWDAFHARNPIRVPVIVGLTIRYYIFSPWLNPRKITFEEYSEAPDLMLETQLEFQDYVRHTILQDAEMGVPKDAWRGVCVDFQNYNEAAWFGCPVHYYEDQVPDTDPLLTDDRKHMLFERGIPDPFEDGIMAKNLRFYDYMRKKIKKYTYKGVPVGGVTPSGLGTDGPFTLAVNLRGATEICLDIYENPEYVRELLGYITEATIERIKAWRKLLGHDPKPSNWAFLDDSIALLSCETYREFVLPCHKRLLSELAGPGPHHIHLCGDATRHFKIIRDELNVYSFDTGYPVDFGGLRAELGPDVEIYGGPSVQFLAAASPEDVRDEVRRILSTGVTEGGRFILREGNNMPPGIPVQNINSMYYAVKAFGGYA